MRITWTPSASPNIERQLIRVMLDDDQEFEEFLDPTQAEWEIDNDDLFDARTVRVEVYAETEYRQSDPLVATFDLPEEKPLSPTNIEFGPNRRIELAA